MELWVRTGCQKRTAAKTQIYSNRSKLKGRHISATPSPSWQVFTVYEQTPIMQLSGEPKGRLRTGDTHHLVVKECYSAQSAWWESGYENSAKSRHFIWYYTDYCTSQQPSITSLCRVASLALLCICCCSFWDVLTKRSTEVCHLVEKLQVRHSREYYPLTVVLEMGRAASHCVTSSPMTILFHSQVRISPQ